MLVESAQPLARTELGVKDSYFNLACYFKLIPVKKDSIYRQTRITWFKSARGIICKGVFAIHDIYLAAEHRSIVIQNTDLFA